MKKFLIFILSFLFVFPATVIAVVGDDEADIRNTVEINISDKTADGCEGKIILCFTNIETERERWLFLDNGEYGEDITNFLSIVPGMYSIEVTMPEGYLLKNIDGRDIGKLFNGNFDGRVLEFAIFDDENYVPDDDTSNNEKDLYEDMPRLLEEFINAAKKDEAYKLFVEKFNKSVEDYYTENKVSTWGYVYLMSLPKNFRIFYDLSPEEAFLVSTTYSYITYSNNSDSYHSWDTWQKNLNDVTGFMSEYKAGLEFELAYYNLMRWDYNYHEATGEMFDFCEYLKEVGGEDAIIKAFSEDGITAYEPTRDEISDIGPSDDGSDNSFAGNTDGGSTASSSSKEDDPGIWDDTIDGVKNNVFTIVILFVLVLIGVGIYFYRKKKNIDILD